MNFYRLFFYSILFFIPNKFFSQDSILIQSFYKGIHNGKIYEEYFINSKDSLKNGAFRQFSKHGKVIKSGAFKNGFPVGVWEFYEAGVWNRKFLEYNFDTYEEIAFIKTDTLQSQFHKKNYQNYEDTFSESCQDFLGVNLR